MDIARKAKHILVTGMSGSGKSTFSHHYLLCADYRRKFIFDHESEFSEKYGVEACQSFDELNEALQDYLYVIFDPSLDDSKPIEEHFLDWCQWVFDSCKTFDGDKLFFCDEIQKITGSLVAEKPLRSILQTGRRQGLDTLFVTQQPNLIHNAIRNQITELVQFRAYEKRALQFLKDMGYELDASVLNDLEYYFIDVKRGNLEKSELAIDIQPGL